MIKQHVLKSANVMNTGFLSKFDGLIKELDTTNPTLPGSATIKRIMGVISRVHPDGSYDVSLNSAT